MRRWALALALAPQVATADVGACVARRSEGDLDGAAGCLAALTESTPTATAWVELAVTQAWAGQLRAAGASYSAALALEPDHVGAQIGLARVTGWRGQRVRAVGMLHAVLDDHPGNPEALETLARLQDARLASRASQAAWDALAATGNPTAPTPSNRGSLAITVGGGSTSDAPSAVAAAELGVAISGATRLRARYDFGALVDPTRPASRPAHQGELGVIWQPSPRSWLGVAATARSDGWSTSLSVAGAAGPIVISAFGRVGQREGVVDSLGSVGVRGGERGWGEGRLFASGGADGAWSVAAVGRAGWTGRRASPEASLGISRNAAATWLQASAAVDLTLTRAHTLRPSLTLLYGPFWRVDAAATWTVQF